MYRFISTTSFIADGRTMTEKGTKGKLDPLTKGLFTCKKDVNYSLLIGDIETSQGTKWRISGMRQVRDEDYAVEYDVERLYEKEESDSMMYPREGNVAVMKVLIDKEREEDEFANECKLLLSLSERYTNWRQRRLFPEVLATGCLSSFLSHGRRSIDVPTEITLPSPKPFFVVERYPLTLEAINMNPRNGFLEVHTSIYLTIGCIKGLRLLHEMGWMMREVSPSRFSVRLRPSSMLVRTEAELADRVVISDLPFATRYRSLDKKFRLESFVGNLKYGSPDAIELKGQTPRDDVVSALFIMLDFFIGSVPWQNCSKTDAIKMKRKAMKTAQIKERKGQVIFSGYDALFDILKEGDPITTPIDYPQLYSKMQVETEKSKPNFSYFGFLKNIRLWYMNGFQDVAVENKNSPVSDRSAKSGKTSKNKRRAA